MTCATATDGHTQESRIAAEQARETEEAARREFEANMRHELRQWRSGELKFVPDVIDLDGDCVTTAIVAGQPPKAAPGSKRPLEPPPSAVSSLRQQERLVRVKQEKAEVEEKADVSRERNALEDQLTCVVCLSARREVLFNCSHLVCCTVCARDMVRCPSTGCNTLVSWRHPVNLAEHAQEFGIGSGQA